MADQIQAALDLNGIAAYLHPSPLLADDWQEVIAAGGRVFGDLGARAPLWWGTWTTDEVTWTQHNDTAGQLDLDQREAAVTLMRITASDRLLLQAQAFVEACEVRLHIHDIEADTEITTLTLTPSDATPQWVSKVAIITEAEAFDAGAPVLLAVWAEARTTDGEGGSGTLLQLELLEYRLTGSDAGLLP